MSSPDYDADVVAVAPAVSPIGIGPAPPPVGGAPPVAVRPNAPDVCVVHVSDSHDLPPWTGRTTGGGRSSRSGGSGGSRRGCGRGRR